MGFSGFDWTAPREVFARICCTLGHRRRARQRFRHLRPCRDRQRGVRRAGTFPLAVERRAAVADGSSPMAAFTRRTARPTWLRCTPQAPQPLGTRLSVPAQHRPHPRSVAHDDPHRPLAAPWQSPGRAVPGNTPRRMRSSLGCGRRLWPRCAALMAVPCSASSSRTASSRVIPSRRCTGPAKTALRDGSTRWLHP